MDSKFVRLIDSLAYRIFVCCFLFFIAIVVLSSSKVFGYRCFTNSSNSMSPVINTGSLTVIHPYDFYDVGESISYYLLSGNRTEIITHRITSIGGNVYVTKGDANEVEDRELVPSRLVIGKVILVIPYLGYFITFVKSFWGTILTILLPAGLIVSVEFARVVIIMETERTKQSVIK